MGMDQWKRIRSFCSNCGQPLEARPSAYKPGCSLTLAGAESMDFRHVGGKIECPPKRRVAEVFEIWGKYDEWKKAK